METAGNLSLSQAALLSGHNKSKIHRAVKSGALSVSQSTPGGAYEIDRSEFERVFPAKEWPSINGVPERDTKLRSAPSSDSGFNDSSAVMAAKLEITEARLLELQETLQRERERADRAESERQRLLEAPRDEIARERAEREWERGEASKRDEERKTEIERLRNDLERSRQEQYKLAAEAEKIRQDVLVDKGFFSRMFSRN